MGHDRWDSAVVYQIYWRSFMDANQDGIGDISGLLSRADHIQQLGIDAIWLNPTYPSPQGDHGYDVSDYFDVEPMFGSLEEFDRMIADLHQRGIMILMDIVPNHVSSQHKWFQSALSGGIGNPDEKRFIIREGTGDGGMNPPNDWISIFGGSSWSPFPSSEGSVQRWYLHMFDPCQPDLNWHHRDVRERFENILRFWLDRGVDGFRVDVAHGLFKAPGLPNREGFGDNWSACWDQPEVHDIYRKWREIIEGYEPSRFLIGEIHTATRERLLEYLRANQLHAAFDFSFLHQDWDGDGFRDRIRANLDLWRDTGSLPVWTLSNHDEIRHWSRYAPLLADGSPDYQEANVRYRSLLALILALPGRIFLYNGEELALPQADVPDEYRRDPAFFRQPSESEYKGRDGCRVPIPWDADLPNAGFTNSEPWLPMPEGWANYSASIQNDDPNSMLNYYRNMIQRRREENWMKSDVIGDVETSSGILSFDKTSGNKRVRVLINFSDSDFRFDSDNTILRTSNSDIANPILTPGELAYVEIWSE